MSRSLRRRLLGALLTATALIWAGSALWSYADSRHEIEELFDAQLAQSARTLLALSQHELKELREDLSGTIAVDHIHFIPDHDDAIEGHEYEHKLAYQIWTTADRNLLMRSDTAPPTPLSEVEKGYSDRLIGGEKWRVFSVSDRDGTFIVQVGESYGIRNELTDLVAKRMLGPILVALPLLAVFIWFVVGTSLAPLLRLAEQVRARAPSDLSPIETGAIPQETEALVKALNDLFGRLESAFNNERRFTSDAAHELRTPLAALKTQAQVALRAQDDAEKKHALEQVVRGVDRASHLLQQLLILARLDPETRGVPTETINLCALAAEQVAEQTCSARSRNIQLGLNETCTGLVPGYRESLRILLRNLVDNALRYTPDGGGVAVSVANDGRYVVLTVEDSGPGVPEEERQKIFKRFYRSEHGRHTQGSGLGLSIVERISDLHRANIRLDRSPLGGLYVEIRFPRPAKA